MGDVDDLLTDLGVEVSMADSAAGRLALGLADGSVILIGDEPPGLRLELSRWIEDEMQGAVVNLTPDGNFVAACPLLATGLLDRRLAVLDAETGELHTLMDAGDTISAFSWAPDARHVMVATADLEIRVAKDLIYFDLDGRRQELPIRGLHDGMILGLAFHPTEPRLAIAFGDGVLAIWSLENGEHIVDLTTLEGPPTQLRFSADGRFLYAESAAGDVWFWDGSDS